MDNNTHLKRLGTLTVYTGPMFAKKTTSLLGEVELALGKSQSVEVYKPVIDTRNDADDVQTHDGISLQKAYGIKPLRVPLDYDFPPTGKEVVVIEEVQFFGPQIVPAVATLMAKGMHVVVAGLDLDSNGNVFGSMGELLALATHVFKLHGECCYCGRPSTRTLRKVSSREVILVGAEDAYEPTCLDCWYMKDPSYLDS